MADLSISNSTTWKSNAYDGVGVSAMYTQAGAMPGVIAPAQALTFSSATFTAPSISAITSAPPGGTIFTLTTVGRYEVNYQATYAENGSLVLYTGSTSPPATPLAYSLVGRAAANSQASGSVLIDVTTSPTYLSVNGAAGNAVPLTIAATASLANASATTVSIKRLT